MEAQSSNDLAQDQIGSGQVSQKPQASCDMLLDAINASMDAMLKSHTFMLSDVLGALSTMKIQVEEQILFQYRVNLQAANAQRQSADQSQG